MDRWLAGPTATYFVRTVWATLRQHQVDDDGEVIDFARSDFIIIGVRTCTIIGYVQVFGLQLILNYKIITSTSSQAEKETLI